MHVVLHEMARAVFDVLEIPVWGREDHAADRVAGYIMFQFGEKVAYRTLVGTSWFLAQSGVAISGMPSGEFSYVRGVQGETLQRFYNTLVHRARRRSGAIRVPEEDAAGGTRRVVPVGIRAAAALVPRHLHAARGSRVAQRCKRWIGSRRQEGQRPAAIAIRDATASPDQPIAMKVSS